MPQSYHIEEIVQQDASSVVYYAVEVATGQPVALRRFFPFGIEGGGLEPDEQSAYQTALSRLAAISHPSLRPILGGGCDPVDGIPYIVTQWIDGLSLSEAVSGGEPDASLAVEWIMQALEVSELLSHVLTQQSIWVETNSDTVLIADERDGFRASFQISPLKWLSGSHEPSFLPIVELAESIMGWQGKLVNDHAARGLGGWLKWLREAPPNTSLQEIREMLAASVGVEPPPPTSKLVKHAIVAGHQQKSRRAPIKVTSQGNSGKLPAILVSFLLIVTLGLGSWMALRPKTTAQIDPPAPKIIQPGVEMAITPAADAPPVDDADSPPEEDPAGSPSETPPTTTSQTAHVTPDGPVYTPGDSAALMEKNGQIVAFEAVLLSMDQTKQKGILLRFASKSDAGVPCGYIHPKHAKGDLSFDSLKALQGKLIQIQGKVRAYKNRPDIEVSNRLSIHLVE